MKWADAITNIASLEKDSTKCAEYYDQLSSVFNKVIEIKSDPEIFKRWGKALTIFVKISDDKEEKKHFLEEICEKFELSSKANINDTESLYYLGRTLIELADLTTDRNKCIILYDESYNKLKLANSLESDDILNYQLGICLKKKAPTLKTLAFNGKIRNN